MKNQLIILVVFTFLIACEKDKGIRYEGFEPIFKESVYNSLSLQENYNYYEIRNNYCVDSTRYVILYSEGINPYTDSVYAPANEQTWALSKMIFIKKLWVTV